METQEKSPAKQIVRAPAQALAVRSAALVTRGLRDLARDSNWLIKKVFTGRSSQLVISPAGEVCALSPMVRQGTERIALYDIERGVPTLALVVPGEPDVCPPGLARCVCVVADGAAPGRGMGRLAAGAARLRSAWQSFSRRLWRFQDFSVVPRVVGHRKLFRRGLARRRGSAIAIVACVEAIASCHAVRCGPGCRA